MRGTLRRPLCAATLLAAGIAPVACGSTTKVLTTNSPPTPIATASSATGQSTTSVTTTSAPSGAATQATASTRTAEAPSYAHEQAPAAQLAAAVSVVRAHGFTPNEPSQYHADQTLRVLVGSRTGSTDGYGQQAFFFLGGRYLGTDSTQTSATLSVVSQSDTEVTLAYPDYSARDPLCCASGASARVTFALNNGRLTPLQPIPPTSSRR
ncbi:MAG: LppP/LprE family lipoprotein [Solirubrobacteraceae bacterium]